MPPEAAADPALLAVISAGGGLCWWWSLPNLLALAWLWAGWLRCWQERRRAGECVCEVEICASAPGLALQSCLMCFPPPSKAHGCIFFLFFLAFSSIFSLSLPLPFLLSLFLWFFFFFFVFLPENQSEERGRVKRESARKAGTNHPAFTVSLAQRGESTCLYKIPRPVNVPANSQTHVASRGSLS